MSDTSTSSGGQGVAAYDAAKDSPARSSFVGFPTNSRRELTPCTRREIVKKHRALEANFPFLTRLIRKSARHAVGSGIHFRCLADDEVFNDSMRRMVEDWWSNKDVYSIDGSVDGWEQKRLAADSMQLDGEHNNILTYHPESGFPCVQNLDVFEIETPCFSALATARTFNPREWDDGVRMNEFERPVEFAVRTLPRLVGDFQRDYRLIPNASMVHMFRRRRAHGHRGMPWGYSGLNQGIDVLDLGALMTGTAKLHSALAVSVKGTGRRGKRGAIAKIQDPSGGASTADTGALEKVFGGGLINYLGENGEMQLLSSNHPGANVMEFRKLLIHEMAVGWDIPFSVAWDMSTAGGTAARYDAEDAQSTFDLIYDQIVWTMVRREIIWFVSWCVKNGHLAQSKDPLWFSKLVFRGPRKLSVDVQRLANSFKTLSRNAGLSIPRWLEEQGFDAYEEMRDNVRYLAYVKKLAEKEGVPVEWIYESTPGSQPMAAAGGEPSEADNSVANSQAVKAEMDAFGVGVRAGALTPTTDDEKAFRAKLGLPGLNADASRAWQEDEGFRRPITLLPKGGAAAPISGPIEE